MWRGFLALLERLPLLFIRGLMRMGADLGERAALKRLYPRARTHTFTGSGHAASLARSSEYVTLINEFLRGEPA